MSLPSSILEVALAALAALVELDAEVLAGAVFEAASEAAGYSAEFQRNCQSSAFLGQGWGYLRGVVLTECYWKVGFAAGWHVAECYVVADSSLEVQRSCQNRSFVRFAGFAWDLSGLEVVEYSQVEFED